MNRSTSFRIWKGGKDQLQVLFPIYKEFLLYYYRRYGTLLRDIPLERDEIVEYLSVQFGEAQSIVFLASEQPIAESAIGFTLLTPRPAQKRHSPQWLLKDLFVNPAYRGQGLGSVLMDEVISHFRAEGAVSISLLTGKVNIEAQGLYEKYGFLRDNSYKDQYNVKYSLQLAK